MKIIPQIDITAPGIVRGNHSVWDPARGWKFPWQFGGRIRKLSRPHEQDYYLSSLVDEVCILRALAEQGMAPPVGEIVFAQNVISTFPDGAWWCDPVGALGYEIKDARSLPPGRFSVEAMRRLPRIEGSAGAWSDISVPDRHNVINGYLVDVRRSAFDMLRWTGPRFDLPDARECPDELRARVHRECQFPPGARSEAYQDFWLRGTLERGQRRVIERAEAMGFAPQPGETVLDIGCQSGGFLQYAANATSGRGRFVGVDIEAGYVDCARALARSFYQNICYRRMDVAKEREAFLAWVRALGRVDHLIMASLEKHLDIFPLIDAIGARRTYIETNAVAKDSGTGPEPKGEMKLLHEVAKRGGVHVGNSRDRNLRRLYRIERP